MTAEAEPTYSQSGEDRIVKALFTYFSERQLRRYVDLGSAFPAGHNNTYLAYTEGATGLLVEADPKYRDETAALRPRDHFLSAAIVPARLAGEGFVEFFRMGNPGHSTVLPGYAEAAAATKGGIQERVRVPTVTINDILSTYMQDDEIDLLSIDVEGLDAEILSELDYARFAPSVIVAENEGGAPVHRPGLEHHGYGLYAYNYINTIYYLRTRFPGVNTSV